VIEREPPRLRRDGNGAVRVESVLVEGLAHAFPIRGQVDDSVVATDVCAATEIARFWGLPSALRRWRYRCRRPLWLRQYGGRGAAVHESWGRSGAF
jgi:hypothetical protein